ncbi:hypothetical protein CPAR01_13171 [Colletotrichum paranaense]|uniref:Uncharacterized protein n=1 Tax=Colletotrichum paranaense TaxID=1914294 RepID=A0ABQ9S6A6_9PEZI|nr:uncharacterized protein CPAR01_13171 [Colletotrichum paranaense]KAK1526643.1 hypothetical protein CPAR01_13171 [Colletotrichum paranaense]
MRSERNRYFIFPSVDYEPDDLIQLGQLIENLYHPDEHIAPPVIQPAGAVHVFHEKDWSLGSPENRPEIWGSLQTFHP